MAGQVDTIKAAFTDEQLIKLIKSKHGNLSEVARSLKVARQTVYNHIKGNAAAEAALDDARETMLDKAESVLYQKAMEGNTAELLFFLKTQGKSRGYTEKVEVEVEQKVRRELEGALDRLQGALDEDTFLKVLDVFGND